MLLLLMAPTPETPTLDKNGAVDLEVRSTEWTNEKQTRNFYSREKKRIHHCSVRGQIVKARILGLKCH